MRSAAARGGGRGGGSSGGRGASAVQRAEAAGGGSGARIFASPLVRKIALEKRIDLAGVTGTGPSGRIVRRDIARLEERREADRGEPGRRAVLGARRVLAWLRGQRRLRRRPWRQVWRRATG